MPGDKLAFIDQWAIAITKERTGYFKLFNSIIH